MSVRNSVDEEADALSDEIAGAEWGTHVEAAGDRDAVRVRLRIDKLFDGVDEGPHEAPYVSGHRPQLARVQRDTEHR